MRGKLSRNDFDNSQLLLTASAALDSINPIHSSVYFGSNFLLMAFYGNAFDLRIRIFHNQSHPLGQIYGARWIEKMDVIQKD